jgi:hypothetical protein
VKDVTLCANPAWTWSNRSFPLLRLRTAISTCAPTDCAASSAVNPRKQLPRSALTTPIARIISTKHTTAQHVRLQLWTTEQRQHAQQALVWRPCRQHVWRINALALRNRQRWQLGRKHTCRRRRSVWRRCSHRRIEHLRRRRIEHACEQAWRHVRWRCSHIERTRARRPVWRQ